jgi:hypothetical protein
MALPVYVINYQCRNCGAPYSVEWDPNTPGHVEPATACPSCASPVRVYLGTGQKSVGGGRPAISSSSSIVSSAAAGRTAHPGKEFPGLATKSTR